MTQKSTKVIVIKQITEKKNHWVNNTHGKDKLHYHYYGITIEWDKWILGKIKSSEMIISNT